MAGDIIGMEDMMAVYEITDLFGIDRETISVPLEKEGDGRVQSEPNGSIEIVVPENVPTRDWLPALKKELQELGLELQEEDDEEWA